MPSFYITELNKLENTQKHLERCQNSFIGQLGKWEGVDFEQVLQLFQSSRLTCDETASKLEMQEILDKLKYVKKAVVVECGSNIPDLKLFEEDLIKIISTVQDVKVHSKLKQEELLCEENRLCEDIKFYNERVCYWSEPVKLDFLRSEVHTKINLSNRVPEDVQKFMDFVKYSNGHENGWSVGDNQLFLKLKKKCKNVDEVALTLNKILPDIKVEDVKIHDEWYVKYLALKKKHNTAIENWKKRKEEIDCTDSKVANQSEELEKNSVTYTNNLEKKCDEKMKVKEEIQNWKKEREASKRMGKALLVEEIKRNKKKSNRQEEINRLKSEMVIRWKAEKNSMEKNRQCNEQIKHNMEHNVRVAVANKMIKIYQMQDKIFLQKKLHNLVEKKKIAEQKQTTSYEVSRDPMRLFKPTQQWINRFLDNNEHVSVKPVNFINKIPKLQIPSWRKNL